MAASVVVASRGTNQQERRRVQCSSRITSRQQGSTILDQSIGLREIAADVANLRIELEIAANLHGWSTRLSGDR
jgi:hypothetical protein